MLILIFIICQSALAQDLPHYDEQQKLYDYQIENLNKRKQEMQAANFSQEEITSAIGQIKKQTLLKASVIKQWETSLKIKIQSFEQEAAGLDNYRQLQVKYFKDMARYNGDLRNYSDQEIVNILISRGDNALKRQPKDTSELKIKLVNIHQEEIALIKKEKNYLNLISSKNSRVSITPAEREKFDISPNPIQASVNFLGNSVRLTNLMSPNPDFIEQSGPVGIVTGINFSNKYSPKNNPNGCREGFTKQSDCHNASKYSARGFDFRTRSGAANEFSLSIRDWTAASGSVSADEMNTSLFFVPRKQVPQLYFDKESGHVISVLPTGEKIFHDPVTMEVQNIPGNALDFAPIDRSLDRHQRKFVDATYNGTGVMIRMDARGRLPENTHTTSFNVNENGTHAVLTYKNKTCKVSKEKLLDISSTPPILKYSDQEMNEKIFKPICGWDVEDLISQAEEATENNTPAKLESWLEGLKEDKERDITASPTSSSTIDFSSECEDLIKDYFGKEENRGELVQYLQTQGRITLQRLALVALKSRKKSEPIQTSIDSLLKERNPDIHKKFAYKAIGMSRNQSLLMAMGELHKESQESDLDANKKLGKEDLYMVEFLVEAEKQHGQSSANGVMNYLSIIKDAIGVDNNDDAEKLKVMGEVIDELDEKQSNFKEKTMAFLKENNCDQLQNPEATCQQPPVAGEEREVASLVDNQNEILNSLLKSINKTETMSKEIFQWNTYWLEVE